MKEIIRVLDVSACGFVPFVCCCFRCYLLAWIQPVDFHIETTFPNPINTTNVMAV